MAGCCIYGAFVIGMFLRKYEVFASLRFSDPVLDNGDDGLDQGQPATKDTILDKVDVFRVQGMTCASCTHSVEASVSGIEGVRRANVELLSGRAEVAYDRTRVQRADIIAVVEAAGFSVDVEGKASMQTIGFGSRLSRWNYGAAFTWSLFCILPILVLESLPTAVLSARRRQSYVLILAGFVQFGFGLPFHRRAALGFIKLSQLPMDVLVSAATTIAYGASIYSMIQGDDKSYAAMSASLVSVLSLGKHLESRAKASIADTLNAFADIVPSQARLYTAQRQGDDVIPVRMLRSGDVIIVYTNERFPCDGKLYSPAGNSYAHRLEIDESFQTGEAHRVVKEVGDVCLAGTLNPGPLSALIQIHSTPQDTHRLVDLLETLLRAQRYKSKLQTTTERTASYIVPLTLVLAGASFMYWLYVRGFDEALSSLVATMVVACPCALGLSTPAALMLAISVSSNHGIVLKRGAQAMESLSKVRTIVFDKTGTITSGRLVLRGWRTCESLPKALRDEGVWWNLVHAAEHDTVHWASSAISREVAKTLDAEHSKGVLPREPAVVTPGRGVACKVGGIAVVVGNEAHLRDHGVCSTLMERDLRDLDVSESCALVAFDGQYAGLMTFADEVVPEAKTTIARLMADGYRVIMMTGDREAVASQVAQTVGLDEYWSAQSPSGKADLIKWLQRDGSVVAMVGDGVNDAPAIGTAEIGIALHTGSPLAVACADLVLMRSSIAQIPQTIHVAQAVQATVMTNILWATTYNALLIPLAIGCGRPFGLVLYPTLAGVLMMGSSLGVTYNSMRMKHKLESLLNSGPSSSTDAGEALVAKSDA